jgi:hypothetical protein
MIKKIIFIFLLHIFEINYCISQIDQCKFYAKNCFRKVYVSATQIPVPSNGMIEIYTNITKFYITNSESIQKSFILELHINKRGKLLSVKVYNKQAGMYSNEEKLLISIISKTRKWHPAICNGRKVNYLLRLPIKLGSS